VNSLLYSTRRLETRHTESSNMDSRTQRTEWKIGRDTTRLGTWTVSNGVKTYYCFRKAEALAKMARLAVQS